MIAATPVQADSVQGGYGPGMMGGPGGGNGTGPGTMGRYAQGVALNLTDAQQAKITKIRDDMRHVHWAMMSPSAT